MAAVDEIAIKLGVKTGDLKAALSDAGATIKKFKKDGEGGADGFAKSMGKAKQGIEIFKSVLAGAGLVGILKGIFSSAVSYAEQYTGEFDENVAATLRLRDAQKELEKTAGKIGTFLAGSMEKFGLAVGAAVFGVDAAADALNAMNDASKKAFDAERVKKVTEATVKLEKERRDSTLATLSDDAKVNFLANEYIKLLLEQGKLKKGSIEWIEKATLAEAKGAEVRKAEAEADKRRADDRKKAAEDEKKLLDDYATAAEDLRKRQSLGDEEEIELIVLKSKKVEQLTKTEKDRLVVLEAAKKLRLIEVELQDLIDKKNRGELTPGDVKRLNELVKQRDVLERQIELKLAQTKATVENQLPAEQAVTSEMMRQAQIQEEMAAREAQIEASRHGTIEQTGDVRNLNNVQLDQLVTNLGRDIESIKAANLNGPQGFTPIEQLMLQQNLDAAKKERDARRQFEQTTRFFGDEYAQRQYAPNDYARLAQLLNPDQMKKDSNNTAVIATGLQNLFPDKFQGALR